VEGGGKLRQLAARNCDTGSISDPLLIFLSIENLCFSASFSDCTTKLTIRLVGIDAPEVSHKKYEPGQPFGQQSTKYLAGLVLNKTVDIKSYGPDRYGPASSNLRESTTLT
jgi:endonuclease YncB( thermonuclease family)